MSGFPKGLAIIIQCRLSSSRLPGKAVKDLGGRTVLEWTLASMKKVPAEYYYVATDEDSFETLQPLAKKMGYEIFKGPLNDVLERYCLLIEKLGCKTVLRATADNPFLFYEAASLLCTEYQKKSQVSKVDYMTWTGLPHGSGVEIFSAASLLQARKMTSDPYDHEHVSPSLYNHKNVFVSLFTKAPSRFYFPDLRTTIDTPRDYRRAVAVVNKLSKGVFTGEPYTTEQIVSAVKDKTVSDTVLFIPSVKKGQGTGHLLRCLNAASEIDGFVYIDKNDCMEETGEIVSSFLSTHPNFKDFQIVHSFPEENEYSLIVTDLFKSSREELSSLRTKGSLVSLDEGSDFHEYSDYLLDIIPSCELERGSNLSEPNFISLPYNKKAEKPAFENIKKVLIVFGGEDSAGLTEKASLYFSKSGLDVSVIVPSSRKKSRESSIPLLSYLEEKNLVTLLSPVPNLKEHLFEYDLVVTHYGLTAYEAKSCGCHVLLLAPSKLHEKLSLKFDFPLFEEKYCASDYEPDYVKSLLSRSDAGAGFAESSDTTVLSSFIKKLSHAHRYLCPVCQSVPQEPDKIVFRTSERTFRRCSKCSMVYISFSSDEEMSYGKSYFSDEYKKQYGRTYLEDFSSIKQSGERRIQEINSSIKMKIASKPSVLDIGCAYGPFLKASQEVGWLPFGTDISEDAVSYVQNTLLIPCVKAAFPDFDSTKEFGLSTFDAVTMWFVIEHFKDLKTVLTKVSSLVKKGGVFAFSTPSLEGISGKKNTAEFFKNSPKDHYSLWEPSKANKILKSFGFKVVKIVSTGHHPERFPVIKKNKCNEKSLRFKAVRVYSNLLSLGDTVEIYCVKEKE